MMNDKPFGLYLYKKNSSEQNVLKELLQFVKTVSPGQSFSFSFIEAQTSLHPQLSLWENLQVENGISNWKDFQHSLIPEHCTLTNLISDPALKCKDADIWEKFLVSMIKGLIGPSKNLLIDIDEDMLSPFLIQQFKKSILTSVPSKTVYLATANSSLWLDCAHSLVERNEYRFQIENLDHVMIKKHWCA